jgi:hypothetical protein
VVAANVFDHPAVLLLVAFVALVRWLISKAKAPTETRQTPVEVDAPPAQPIRRGGESRAEEERIRKFLEALGQPAGTPPPKMTPRSSVPPKIFPTLPPLKTKPPPLARDPARAAIPPPLPPEAALPANVPAVETGYQVYDVTRQTSSEPTSETRQPATVRTAAQFKLGTPQDLRTAIVLREIFGPPRSLQPIDLTSGL